MGQYYCAVNLDSKEVLYPLNGLKLTEHSYIAENGYANSYISKLSQLMMGPWKGQRVYIVGDYYDTDDDDYPRPENILEDYPELSNATLYSYAAKNFEVIRYGREEMREFRIPQYLCNSITKQYIDLRDLPAEWTSTYPDDVEKRFGFFPLTLLLALGNGLGSGDYYAKNVELIGSWVPVTRGVFFSEEIPDGYEEFRPDFTEVGYGY